MGILFDCGIFCHIEIGGVQATFILHVLGLIDIGGQCYTVGGRQGKQYLFCIGLYQHTGTYGPYLVLFASDGVSHLLCVAEKRYFESNRYNVPRQVGQVQGEGRTLRFIERRQVHAIPQRTIASFLHVAVFPIELNGLCLGRTIIAGSPRRECQQGGQHD